MPNLADAHLTYIGTPWGQRPPSAQAWDTTACYDAYPRDGGAQLGWVWRVGGSWTAMSCGDETWFGHGDARWAAATALWDHDEARCNNRAHNLSESQRT